MCVFVCATGVCVGSCQPLQIYGFAASSSAMPWRCLICNQPTYRRPPKNWCQDCKECRRGFNRRWPRVRFKGKFTASPEGKPEPPESTPGGDVAAAQPGPESEMVCEKEHPSPRSREEQSHHVQAEALLCGLQGTAPAQDQSQADPTPWLVKPGPMDFPGWVAAAENVHSILVRLLENCIAQFPCFGPGHSGKIWASQTSHRNRFGHSDWCVDRFAGRCGQRSSARSVVQVLQSQYEETKGSGKHADHATSLFQRVAERSKPQGAFVLLNHAARGEASASRFVRVYALG